jgi:Domain of unknown function (DUF4252)
MKKLTFLLLIFLLPLIAVAQSATTEALQKQYSDAFSLYFYKNTLRMLNQMDSPEFDELVKDIEKMKFLMIDKSKMQFATADYKKLLKEYSAESYEEIMTTRYQGKNFDIYLKDKKGSTLGTVMLVNDSTSLYVLDILGTIDVSKATQLFSTLDESSDIGKKIKSFLDDDSSNKRREFKFHNQ